MNADKADLRRQLRRKRARGSDEALCRNILAHPWFRDAKTVMAYMAMAAEPDLELVLRNALEDGKRLVLPRCEDEARMTGRLVTGLGDLIPGPFGILEPSDALPIVPAAEIELVLTPGLAFDVLGGRLGRGRGYYDRFLTGFPGRCIGIAYEESLLDRVPMEPWDRPMNALITDRRVLVCGGTEDDRI